MRTGASVAAGQLGDAAGEPEALGADEGVALGAVDWLALAPGSADGLALGWQSFSGFVRSP
jgi:hypothetical protein